MVKRGCFSLTAEEEGSPSKLIKFAEGMPQVAKSSDASQDEDLKYYRKQFMKHISTLWRNPKLIPRAVDWVDDRVLEEANKLECDVFKSISTLGRLDETWAASWLVANSSLTLKRLEEVCDKDPEGVKQLYIFALVSSLQVKFNQAMRVKAIMNLTFEARAQQCGHRLGKVNDTNLKHPDRGAINWGVIGVYSPMWEDGVDRLRRIRHKPTGHVGTIPDHVIVDKHFELLQNWDDYEAALVRKPSDFPCKDFFASGCGPHRVAQWQGAKDRTLDALVANCQGQYELKMEEVADDNILVTPQKFRQTSKDDHKKQGMKVAREALDNKKGQMSSLRSVKFS